MIQEIKKIKSVQGILELPGDKSISHRSVMFASMAAGESVIYNCQKSEDVNSSIDCFRAMGCQIEKNGNEIRVNGKGFGGFDKPDKKLDVGNSGTLARLISGILSAQKFETELIGDESMSSRPMKRVIDPLTEMGAVIKASENVTLPLKILPSEHLKPIEYKLPVASAQVKSCVLLAGLHLDDNTVIIEPEPTRNHTENLLGLKVEEFEGGRKIYINRANWPKAQKFNVPSDISTAAFFLVLAVLTPGSQLRLNNVLLNSTRDGVVTILKRMGADLKIENQKTMNGEISGDIIIKSSNLNNVEIEHEIIPNLIDEIPILSVAGLFAKGNFKVTGAEELRVKECDRINAMCRNFEKLGLDVNEFNDGFEISGDISGDDFVFDSFGDHRIAMAFGILSMLIEKTTSINNFEACAVSNPDFLEQVKAVTL